MVWTHTHLYHHSFFNVGSQMTFPPAGLLCLGYLTRWKLHRLTANICFFFFIQHNKTAVLVTEDMKKMVQIPILRSRAARNTKVFGASLSELQDRGLVEDGVPVVLRRLVEHLRKHGEKS